MHCIYTGDLLLLARNEGIEGVDDIIRTIAQAQAKLADKVAAHFEVEHCATNFDMDSIASAFAPRTQDQICPEELAELDDGSDWVNFPEGETVPVSMIVLYRDANTQAPMDPPMAFGCKAFDDDGAESLCRLVVGPGAEILWVTETDNVDVALDSYFRGAKPRPEVATSRPSQPLINEVQEIPVTVQDSEQGYEDATGSITLLPLGFAARFKGYTDNVSEDDLGELFIVTKQKDKLSLLVWADVNCEEPTHKISLEGARNLNREILHRTNHQHDQDVVDTPD
jgi:hypothetical protein